MQQCVVYGIKLIGDDQPIRYVGQTSSIKKRIYQHLYRAKLDSAHPLYRWLKKHHSQVEFVILEQCSQLTIDTAEIFWIDFLNTHISKNGYNLSIGGESTARGATWNLTPETRQKQSQAARSRTDEWRQQVSQHRKDYFSSSDNIEKHRIACVPHNTSDKGQYANHIRWHVDRGLVSPKCAICVSS